MNPTLDVSSKMIETMRDELELLGSLIRAERSTPIKANEECTDEQLERVYALRDKMAMPTTESDHLDRLNKALGMLAPKGYWFANLLEGIYLAKTTEEAVELAKAARVHIDKSLSHGPDKQSTTEGADPVANEHLPMLPIEVGDILVPKAKSVAVQFPKGERFIVTAVDGEKFHVCQFPGNHHGYWWKEHADDQQFAHWVNPKAHPPKPDQQRVVLTDEEVERIVEEERMNVTPLSSAVTGEPTEGGEEEEAERREEYLTGFGEAFRYARDHGYLAPAKADVEAMVQAAYSGVLDWTMARDVGSRRVLNKEELAEHLEYLKTKLRARLTARFDPSHA